MARDKAFRYRVRYAAMRTSADRLAARVLTGVSITLQVGQTVSLSGLRALGFSPLVVCPPKQRAMCTPLRRILKAGGRGQVSLRRGTALDYRIVRGVARLAISAPGPASKLPQARTHIVMHQTLYYQTLGSQRARHPTTQESLNQKCPTVPRLPSTGALHPGSGYLCAPRENPSETECRARARADASGAAR
jgi:hypothetical protein